MNFILFNLTALWKSYEVYFETPINIHKPRTMKIKRNLGMKLEYTFLSGSYINNLCHNTQKNISHQSDD